MIVFSWMSWHFIMAAIFDSNTNTDKTFTRWPKLFWIIEKYISHAQITYFCANPLSVSSCHGRLACPARHMPMGRTENPRIRIIFWTPCAMFSLYKTVSVSVTYFCANPLSVSSCHGRLACPARHMPMGRTENPRIRVISVPLSLKIGTIDT